MIASFTPVAQHQPSLVGSEMVQGRDSLKIFFCCLPSTTAALMAALAPDMASIHAWGRGRARVGCLLTRDAYGHSRESILHPSLAQDRPPAVKEYFQRTPHRDPSADRQAFPHDFGRPASGEEMRHPIAD